ncbi:hypothetical protein LOAG_14314 [Loa loa]|uniref:Uncharacterized protein n=1 Tax=Loa loa TaxID=7209 RepID=A0A1S0THZ1_LOALO|nr:hypothetical protein LOAG_14314 [Loa loa]EFO14211.1 hypothetical protein LOAG_14314 [Loa loa]
MSSFDDPVIPRTQESEISQVGKFWKFNCLPAFTVIVMAIGWDKLGLSCLLAKNEFTHDRWPSTRKLFFRENLYKSQQVNAVAFPDILYLFISINMHLKLGQQEGKEYQQVNANIQKFEQNSKKSVSV